MVPPPPPSCWPKASRIPPKSEVGVPSLPVRVPVAGCGAAAPAKASSVAPSFESWPPRTHLGDAWAAKVGAGTAVWAITSTLAARRLLTNGPATPPRAKTVLPSWPSSRPLCVVSTGGAAAAPANANWTFASREAAVPGWPVCDIA